MLYKIFVICIICGICEGLLLQKAKTTGDKIIFDHFSLYHVFLGVFFFLLAWLGNFWWMIPFFILLQDLCSKLTQELEWFKPGDWMTWPTYKLYFGFLPLSYIFLITLSVIGFIITF